MGAGANTFRWTITNACGASFDDVIINAIATPNPVVFTYRGASVSYGVVASNTTPFRCWLDKNLGASQVATSSTDAAAYGDLFQWGRLDDGHQDRISLSTTTTSSIDIPGHNKIILVLPSPFNWRSPQNNALWQGVGGINNPCPTGYRIPTISELESERVSWSTNDVTGAFNSPLKLTMAGNRQNITGNLQSFVNIRGLYWSSSVLGINARFLMFDASTANTLDGPSGHRWHGESVRCIKD